MSMSMLTRFVLLVACLLCSSAFSVNHPLTTSKSLLRTSIPPRLSTRTFGSTRRFSTSNDSELLNDSSEAAKSPKEVVVSESLVLPFAAHIAWDAFSDLPRQADFSPWLHSVEYLKQPEKSEGPAETKWTMGFKGFRFSWNAISTRLERPHTIEWESTSGLKNFGCVNFQPLDEHKTLMTMKMTFVAPRIAASLMRRGMASFVENKMLKSTLVNFRDIIVNKDLAEQ